MLGDKDVQDFLKKYDIIILAETMKKADYEVKFPNYKSFHHARNCKHPKAKRYGGGILILVSKILSKHVKIEPRLEHLLWLNIFNKHHIGILYIPPESSTYAAGSGIDYYGSLYAEIERKMSHNNLVYLCGDGNARTAELIDFLPDEIGSDYQPLTSVRVNCDKTVNKYGRKLIDICKNTGLQILNGREPFQNATNKFSCHKWNGKSCPDTFLTLPCAVKYIENLEILDRRVESDHNPLSFCIRDNFTLNCPRSSCYGPAKYIWDPNKQNQFIESIQHQDNVSKCHLENFLCNISGDCKNSEETISSFYKYISEQIKPIFRKTKPKPNSTFPSNKWFDDELKRKKSELGQAITNRVSMEEERALRADYKRLIQKKKRKYSDELTAKLKDMSSNNPNDYWKFWKNARINNTGENLHINLDTFTDHFKEGMTQNSNKLLELIDTIVTDESFVNLSTPPCLKASIVNDILNGPILENEVTSALRKAKQNKAGGSDGIPIEFFKCSKGEFVKPLVALYNYVLESGVYPDQWSLGIINPIYKQKEKNIADNYRKVTLLPALSKCFESVLNNRLIFCKSTLQTDDPLQNGFKSDARAIDNSFILNGLIEKSTASKRPLYMAFVDFKSAFDKIGRNALLFKMHSQHIRGKFLKIIRNMLGKAKSQVKWNGELGEIFDNLNGVLQGGVISPTLFKIFLEDLPNFLGNDIGVKVGDALINYLLHADDLVLISETRAGLQKLLDRLNTFCKRWDMIVNLVKTKIMIFNRRYQLNDSDGNFTFDGGVIEETDRYKYLGTIISNTPSDPFKYNYRFLRDKALRAIYALRLSIRRSTGISLPIELLVKSFNVQIRPVVDYGAELWAQVHPIPDIEYVQNFFLKTSLHIREQTPTLALLGELGRFPLYLKQHELLLRYFKRLQTVDKTKVLYKMYEDLVNLDLQGHNTWVTKARTIIYSIGNTGPLNLRTPKSSVDTNQLYTNFTQKWLSDVNDSRTNPKLRSYCLFKSEFRMEDYFSTIRDRKHIIALLRFRTSSHNLRIELGRHTIPITPIEERTCKFCPSGAIDDEIHLMLDCNFHSHERNIFLKSIEDITSISNFNKRDGFSTIMSSKSPTIQNALGKFIHGCFQRRQNSEAH